MRSRVAMKEGFEGCAVLERGVIGALRVCLERVCLGLVFFGGAIPLAGCTPTEIKWAEEVRLHDGRVVVVKRRTELTASGFPVQRRGFQKYHELCYEPMGVYWKSKPSYPPHVFDIVDGKVYIKVPVDHCETCMLQGYPPWDALYFEWDNGAWKKLDETPMLRTLRFNLLSSTHASGGSFYYEGKLVPAEAYDARGLITLAEKERRDGSIYAFMQATGRTGPGVEPGACERCKNTWGRVQTTETPEVFLPSESKTCNW